MFENQEILNHELFKQGYVLLVDKPLGWTSFQAVNMIKKNINNNCKNLGKIKVGHAGTLDPLATGLLIICTGKATKSINEIQLQKKTYEGTITLGATTPSFDMETQINNVFSIDHITEEMIKKQALNMTGQILQTPPIFSAIKKNGKRLYEHARNGQKVNIEPRLVNIELFEITKINLPEVEFKIICSKGTYIRAIANDFGIGLNTGAYLKKLIRTKIGNYELKNAKTPREYANIINQKINIKENGEY